MTRNWIQVGRKVNSDKRVYLKIIWQLFHRMVSIELIFIRGQYVKCLCVNVFLHCNQSCADNEYIFLFVRHNTENNKHFSSLLPRATIAAVIIT